MSDSPADTGIDAAILDRMRDTLVILQAKHADEDRAEVLTDLTAIREACTRLPAGATVILVEGASEEAAVCTTWPPLSRHLLGAPRPLWCQPGQQPRG